VVFHGIKFPTSMAFLRPDDIFVLEKNEGIVNLELLSQTMIEVVTMTHYTFSCTIMYYIPKLQQWMLMMLPKREAIMRYYQ
jgi:hypothetical protein